jgi:methionyl-tRNA formyltransferase
MRLILMGTGPFAIPSFEALRQAGHDIPLVLVRPERPGHGGKLRPAPVRQWADAAGLPVEAFSSTNDSPVIEHLRSLAADLMVVCDYGQILTADCLAAARLGGINLHGSLLPAHRGAAPVQWSILRGDPQAGCSVIWMTPRLDAGPVIAQAVTPVGPAENAADLETRLAAIGCEPILSAIEQLSRLSAEDDPAQIGISQPPRASSLAPRLAKSMASSIPLSPPRCLNAWCADSSLGPAPSESSSSASARRFASCCSVAGLSAGGQKPRHPIRRSPPAAGCADVNWPTSSTPTTRRNRRRGRRAARTPASRHTPQATAAGLPPSWQWSAKREPACC